MKPFLVAALLSAAGLGTEAWSAEKTVVLSVPGMNCAACPITVRKALHKVPGVSAVSATLSPPEARVTFDDAAARVEQLTEATKNAGYPATLKPAE